MDISWEEAKSIVSANSRGMRNLAADNKEVIEHDRVVLEKLKARIEEVINNESEGFSNGFFAKLNRRSPKDFWLIDQESPIVKEELKVCGFC